MAKRQKRRRPTITITVDADLLARVDALADAERVSRSDVVEKYIRDGVGQHETIVRAFSNPIITGALFKALGDPVVLKQMVAALGEDMRDDQLQLFREAMAGVVDIGARAAAESVKPAKPPRPKKSGK